ncbi:uncharacterized protein TRIADDRAFT_63338 [Trichoplax adhaerens]|uniref:C-CAP/cofactor C-like domain-containing protein n=1 Tax=Trichoplax adhaerens TaxID=10228 RepID=B3S128_TRIAD|nr:hypothetical protein TRIADDRAFT_63338 [Trichoplax adhaerens]EDV23164.1 hypothetical protein TRIADDRAFT_63338 [Trichoplax adhaerens]|eukprot:XP_002114074.1 hypothetical protein TRIADDRAFT_63338 [Trichoplax adhaerens]
MANDQRLASLLDRLESVTNRLEKIPGKGGQPADDEGSAFTENSLQAELTKKAYEAHRAVVVTASKCKLPEAAALQNLLKPLSNAISEVQAFRDKNRGSKFFNHLSEVYEFILCFGWVTVSPKPANYVKTNYESAQFYLNKVLKEFKTSDPQQADWARSIGRFMNALIGYINDYNAIGLNWNAEGKDVSAVSAGAPAAPPPPPPPAPVTADPPKNSGNERAALMSQLNKGADVTKGLKKVTNDMKTHKNPALRASGVVSSTSTPGKPAVSPKPAATKPVAKKPPVFRLDGKKWIVENQEGNQDLVISDTNMRQSVYIYKCNNCVIQVKGKVNSIAMDTCKKSAIVFDHVISVMDFVNCQSVKVQVNGAVPTISIGNTDGIQVYLSKEAMQTTIISSKSSEMNISTPTGNDGDMVENAVPEQFTTVWDDKKKCFDTYASEITA